MRAYSDRAWFRVAQGLDDVDGQGVYDPPTMQCQQWPLFETLERLCAILGHEGGFASHQLGLSMHAQTPLVG